MPLSIASQLASSCFPMNACTYVRMHARTHTHKDLPDQLSADLLPSLCLFLTRDRSVGQRCNLSRAMFSWETDGRDTFESGLRRPLTCQHLETKPMLLQWNVLRWWWWSIFIAQHDMKCTRIHFTNKILCSTELCYAIMIMETTWQLKINF